MPGLDGSNETKRTQLNDWVRAGGPSVKRQAGMNQRLTTLFWLSLPSSLFLFFALCISWNWATAFLAASAWQWGLLVGYWLALRDQAKEAADASPT